MSAYWTSSLSPSNSSEAWVIDFDTGMLSLKIQHQIEIDI